jgi:hypothetical protein
LSIAARKIARLRLPGSQEDPARPYVGEGWRNKTQPILPFLSVNLQTTAAKS